MHQHVVVRQSRLVRFEHDQISEPKTRLTHTLKAQLQVCTNLQMPLLHLSIEWQCLKALDPSIALRPG